MNLHQIYIFHISSWWHSFITTTCLFMYHISCSFLVKHQITQVTQPLKQHRFGTLWLLAFPKTKITFERKEISDCQWDSGKYNGEADGDWENCEGDSASLSYVQCFLYLVSSSINVSIFHITWLDTFWTDFILAWRETGKMGEEDRREEEKRSQRIGSNVCNSQHMMDTFCVVTSTITLHNTWFLRQNQWVKATKE